MIINGLSTPLGNTPAHGVMGGRFSVRCRLGLNILAKKLLVLLFGDECFRTGRHHAYPGGQIPDFCPDLAIADGGELLVLAPGVERFGEDPQVDKLIRKYGCKGRLNTLEQFEKPDNQDLRDNMGAAHGSSDGRLHITYAVKNITKEEIEGVGFGAADYDEPVKRYAPETQQYGYNILPDGEVIYFIPNPALGLWINREKF